MRFFSKLRQSLIGAKGWQYLKYAIGEIILVVIGILIAVWINNTNEARKAAKNRKELAQKVKQQMIQDTLNLGKVIRFNESRRPLYDNILRETPPEESIKDCEFCPWLIISNLNIANMDPKVKAMLNDASLSSDSLSMKLRTIEEHYEDKMTILKLLEESIVNNLKENMDYLQANYDWFAQFIANNKCNEDCRNYFDNSSDYRNRMAYIELLIMKAYNSELIIFKDILGFQLERLGKELE